MWYWISVTPIIIVFGTLAVLATPYLLLIALTLAVVAIPYVLIRSISDWWHERSA